MPAAKTGSPSSGPKKGTIVIAEKKPFFTTLLKKESISRSFFIIHVENGISGLKTMKKLMPTIAVIDFDTYSISEQYESLKIIQRQYKNMPIILLCNVIPDEIKMAINQHDLVSYIQKPIQGRKLEDVIKRKIE
jgi:DNA-binding NtrC family response regulator